MPNASSTHSPVKARLPHTSGLQALTSEDWRKCHKVFTDFQALCMDSFLERWAEYMQSAGYLQFTTAKRSDCVESCMALLNPLLEHYSLDTPPTFEHLCRNTDGWAGVLLESGLRHWRRGITGGMFLGCFKTFVWAIKDALQALPLRHPAQSESTLQNSRTLLDIYANAFEVLWMDACLQTQHHDHDSGKDEVYRRLTLEKCRFENVLNTTSDGVLVVDPACRITTTNRSARRYAGENITGKLLWEVLGLEGSSPEEFFLYYPVGQTVEVSLFSPELVFNLSIASLGDVSLADKGEYLIFLTNISPQVTQREILEEAVERHAAGLLREKQQLEEMNITLRNVLRNINAERERGMRELADSLRASLLPVLGRLIHEADSERRESLVGTLRKQLEALPDGGASAPGDELQPGGLRYNEAIRKLTVSEFKICQMIQAGHSSKEIADILRISLETVQTHRKNIRRKLGVRGHDAQLAMFLLTRES